jgi:hypothetical protein
LIPARFQSGRLNFKTIQLIISHQQLRLRGIDLLASLQQLGRHLLLNFLIELYDLQPGFVHSIGSADKSSRVRS